MKKIFKAFAASLLLMPTYALSQENLVPQVSDFAMPPNVKSPVLSPDGNLIVFGSYDNKGEEIVKIIDINALATSFLRLDEEFLDINFIGDTKKAPTEFASADFDLKGNLFISQDKVFSYEKRAKYDQYGRFRRIIAADLKAKTSVQFKSVAYPSDYQYRKAKPNLIFTPSVHGDLIYLMQFTNKGRDNWNVGEFEYPKSDFRQTGTGNEDTIDWTFDQNGDPFTRLDYDRDTKTTEIWQKVNEKWVKVLSGTNSFKPAFSLAGLSPKGAPLFVRRLASEVGTIEMIEPNSLEVKAFIDSKEFEIQEVLTDKWSGEAVGAKVGGLYSEYFYFDTNYKTIQEKLSPKFEGKLLKILDLNLDKSRAIISVESVNLPIAYYFYDFQKDKLLSFGSQYPSLSKKPNSEIEALEFTANDGTKVPVYVTLPPNVENAKNLPAVMLLPDSPETRAYPIFDYLPQFIASRGYLVVQPQLRGSIGFGANHTRKGLEKWGTIIQSDIEESANWAIKSGLVDKDKFCIMGKNFGGHGAMMEMEANPDRFKCAISHNGISDLGKWLAASGFESSSSIYWRAIISSWNSDEIQKLSPRRNVSNIKGNMLITHGISSLDIDLEQSYEMAQALKRANKNYKYVEIPFGDSQLSKKPARESFLRELEAFLLQNLGKPIVH